MSSEDRLLVLANRSAGTLRRTGGESPLETAARRAGLEPEIVWTRGARHLQRVLRERVIGHVPRVAIAGGDGTLHYAVQLLARSGVTLGIVPQGTANNIATTLGVPRDPDEAFRLIASGSKRTIDLGLANGRWFTEAAGVGLFADLLHVTHASHGLQAAFRALRLTLATVLFRRPRHITLVLDGQPVLGEVLNVMVANTALVGYNVPIAPEAVLEDRQLDVITVAPLGLMEVIRYYRAMRRSEHIALPKVSRRLAARVSILTRGAARAHVDDRCILRTPLEIEAVPKALSVYAPPAPARELAAAS